MNYKLSKEIPPIYTRLKQVFGVEFKDIIITYGDTIYCADDLPGHSIAHELIHIEQQEKYGAEQWWDRYIADPKFRLDQEIPAYQAEARHLHDHYVETTREYRRRWIKFMAMQLSGRMYGYMMSLQDAVRLLR